MTVQTQSHSIGEIDLTVFNDGRFNLPSSFFINVPDEVPQKAQTEVGANLWLIHSGSKRVLVDTGSNQALKAVYPETGMAWAGLQAEQPTDVVLTHLHADHIGGFANRDALGGVPIHVMRAEWEFWTDPILLANAPHENRQMIEMIQSLADGIYERVVLHDGEDEIAPGVSLINLPGHTPGHAGLKLRNGDAELVIVADAVISEVLQIAHPDISYALDSDADLAAQTRRSLLADMADSGALIAATHFAFPGLGYVIRDGANYRFAPL